MAVVKKWLGYRTAAGAGRISGSELDRIRPASWVDEWNTELLDLLRALTHTLDLRPDQDQLLEQVCASPLIPAHQFTVVPADDPRRKPPQRTGSAGQMRLDG